MAGTVRLDSLAFPVWGERFGIERTGDGLLSIVRVGDGASVGSMRLDEDSNGLVVRALCIDEAHRSFGAGSEAAYLFNRTCDAAGVPLVRVWAPPDRGLAVYFWIRMGYQPRGGPGPAGGIWFERTRAGGQR